MRRIAKIMNVDKKTVQRKVEFLAKKAKRKHKELLSSLHKKVEQVHFDDLITIEHTKLKPVSVSIAVDADTRVILGAKVSQIPAFGHLAQLSRKKYGKRICKHREGLKELFLEFSSTLSDNPILKSDKHRFYPSFVKKYCRDATHLTYVGRRACVVGQGELKKGGHDPLYFINHTCGMLRDNLKRLARKTWCTTKKIEMLQKHLDIYLWYHNFEYLRSKLTP